VAKPEDLHEWVSFEDPDEERTYMFDVSYLLSNWMCIYGQGCQGVHEEATPELMQGCCSFGAHFVDEADEKTVKRSAKRLSSRHWQFKDKAKKIGWSTTDKNGTVKTRVVDGACIFLNRPGFEGGVGCALHIAATEAGERPMDWKPDVCWQVPLRNQDTTDEDGHVVTFIREWKRRDWGEGGHEFHWWCTDDKRAFVGDKPTYVYLKDEITEMVGPKVYALLAKELEARKKTAVSHPVTISRKSTTR
jgi:hypothetical protein